MLNEHLKRIGYLQLLLALSVLVGFMMGSNMFWAVFDFAVLIICGASAFYLLRKKADSK